MQVRDINLTETMSLESVIRLLAYKIFEKDKKFYYWVTVPEDYGFINVELANTKTILSKKRESSWKLHVSFDIEALYKEFNTLRSEFNGEKSTLEIFASSPGPLELFLRCVRDYFGGSNFFFKIIDFEQIQKDYKGAVSFYQGRLLYGGEITIYIDGDPEDYDRFRKILMVVLKQAGIGAGLVPSSDVQLDYYTSLRNEKGEDGEYIAAHELAPGQYNPANEEVPKVFQEAIAQAQKYAKEFAKQKIQVIERYQKLQKKLAKKYRKNFFGKDNEVIKKVVSLIRYIILTAGDQPTAETQKLIKLFTECTYKLSLDVIEEAFRKTCKELKAENIAEIEIWKAKEAILQGRYEYLRHKNAGKAILQVLKRSPSFLLVFPVPVVWYLSLKNKKKWDQNIDVQPVKLTAEQHKEFKTLKQELKEIKMGRAYWPAQPPQEKNELESMLINQYGKFRMGLTFFPVNTENAKLFLPQKKIERLVQLSK